MKRVKKRATVKDVAQRAGVTIGTVSHVLNGTAPISEQTMKRVHQAIEELGYVPNMAARAMRNKDRRNVGILVPKLTNSFYTLVVSAYMEEADKENVVVSIVGYEYSLEKEKWGLYSLMQQSVGTIIIIGGSGDEAYIQDLLDRGISVILADRRSAFPDVSSVEYDNSRGMSEAVEYLKKKQYAAIGFLGEPMVLNNLKDRLEGYRQALEQHGYAYNENHVFVSNTPLLNHVKSGYLYAKEILENHSREELPDAFIITSDLIAIGAMRAMQEAGYGIPEDFGIIGFDNLEISSYIRPSLTTVEQDSVQFGKELWRLTKDGREGCSAQQVCLGQRLIVRESC